ncbi:hypothetical protein V6N13_040364 [Hibiscus sabdariffa]
MTTGRINQVAFLRDVRLAWSSTHYLGRGEAITGREHCLCRGTKCRSYERTRPRPYAHEIFRTQHRIAIAPLGLDGQKGRTLKRSAARQFDA